MVNIARDLGLAKDPPEVLASALDSFKKARNRTEARDSHHAISNLFDAEMRRRIWWDIFYYDVYVFSLVTCPTILNLTLTDLCRTPWAMNRLLGTISRQRCPLAMLMRKFFPQFPHGYRPSKILLLGRAIIEMGFIISRLNAGMSLAVIKLNSLN